MYQVIKGIAASGGIALGTAYVIKEVAYTFDTYSQKQALDEWARFEVALWKAESELLQIREKVVTEQGEENAAIFDAQLLILHDPDLLQMIKDKLKLDQRTAESALDESATFISRYLSKWMMHICKNVQQT